MIRPGTTLIELLIVSALVATLFVTMMALAYASLSMQGRTRAMLTVHENLRFALGRIVGRIAEASSLTIPVLGSSSSTLMVQTASSSTNPTTLVFDNGSLWISEGTGTRSALTSGEIEVTGFTVTRVSSTTPGVRIVLTGRLQNAATVFDASLTVTTTVMIRR